MYKRQGVDRDTSRTPPGTSVGGNPRDGGEATGQKRPLRACLLYTSDAADERSSVDLGGRRIIKKKNEERAGSGRSLRSKSGRRTETETHR